MFSTKTMIAAASLAVLAAAGEGSGAAAPWEDHDRRAPAGQPQPGWQHRALANPVAIAQALRPHRYRVLGKPYFVRGRYVVRSFDRLGRIVLVQVDPYSGAFLGEVFL